MEKKYLYLVISILYLLSVVCTIGIFGTMVDLKYQVDEKYWLIDKEDGLSKNQKQEEVQKLDNKANRLNTKIGFLAVFAFASFVAGTVLVYKRKKILSK